MFFFSVILNCHCTVPNGESSYNRGFRCILGMIVGSEGISQSPPLFLAKSMSHVAFHLCSSTNMRGSREHCPCWGRLILKSRRGSFTRNQKRLHHGQPPSSFVSSSDDARSSTAMFRVISYLGLKMPPRSSTTGHRDPHRLTTSTKGRFFEPQPDVMEIVAICRHIVR